MLYRLGHIIRLKYDQPGETYNINPKGVAVDVMNGPTLFTESGAAIDVLKHTGCLRDTAYRQVCREGWCNGIQKDGRKKVL